MSGGSFNEFQFSTAFDLGADEGDITSVEAQDTATFVNLPIDDGDLSATEAQDTALFVDQSYGYLDATEEQDTAYFTDLESQLIVTRAYSQIGAQMDDTIRFTRGFTQTVSTLTSIADFTRAYAQVVNNGINDSARFFTRTYVQLLCKYTPNFAWIDDMFMDIVFPYDISLNSICSEVYESDDTVVDSGVSQRTPRWQYPLHEADVAYGVRTMEQLHALKQFWRVVHGTQYGFLFQDHLDYTSTFAVAFDARKAPDTSATDQLIGTGNNVTPSYQLQKTYNTVDAYNGSVLHSAIRLITKPQPNSVKVSINGTEVFNFTVDYNTGIITFTSTVTASFPSDNLSITTADGSQHSTVSGPTGAFSSFSVGQHVVMSGWANSTNNVDYSLVTSIVSIAGDGSSMVLLMPLGYGVAETAMGVTVATNPSPLTGQTIKAGYLFWIPMRFNTKRLPLTLQEYGIGAATEVKLVELRPIEAE